MKTKTNRKNKYLWVLAALLLLLLPFFESVLSIKVKAEETETQSPTYTDVMDDLEKDESFSVDDYPAKADDYSLQVIQIAESTDKELFVYVYQPSKTTKVLTATTIRLSMPVIGVDSEWHDYDLSLLSSHGVFDKYKVNGVTVKEDSVRYYDITAIHRAFDSTIDTETDFNYDQTINEVVFEVAQLWKLETKNGRVFYNVETTETIKITNKLVGYIKYDNGFKFYSDTCDSHFVAFSTDKPIDTLLEADVEYYTQSYTWFTGSIVGSSEPTIGNPVQQFTSLGGENASGSNTGDGLFGKKYTWKRFESVKDFIAAEKEDLNLTNGNLEDLEKMDWILRFAETDHTVTVGQGTYIDKTLVSSVTVLRLKFVTQGETYNLGVVDNKQTGSDEPFAKADTLFDDFVEWLDEWWQGLDILSVLLALLGIVLIFTIAGNIINVVLGFAFKILWWIIGLPFTLLGWIFGLFKKRK